MILRRTLLILLATLSASLSASQGAVGDDAMGHSRHGSAFDTGMRQKPWRMDGIGTAHFPITSKNPEVQAWFDQGNALLQSFWYEEAERSFRWCLKLDPECAMAYWGMARAGLNWSTGLADFPEAKRFKDFLKEAVRRKDSVTPRERLYIEAWDAAMQAEMPERIKVLNQKLQEIVLQYPDDVEAEVLLAMFSIESGNALGTELIVRDILQKNPDHPGAHHTRIHNWDGVFAEQAIPSCQAYGKLVPGIGHANHMPGHNYSKIGMWHEAARSMDAATRVELRYMNERLALPFETWNYAHNRNYLCYIQEQLGLATASLQGASDLLAAPREPKRAKEMEYGTADQGLAAQARALIKFERWDEILKPGTIEWRDTDEAKALRAFVETIAYAGQGKPVDARSRLAETKELFHALAEKFKALAPPGEAFASVEMSAAEGLICAAEGNLLDATRFLTEAAAIEKKQRDAHQYSNDPPNAAWPVNRLLGDVYLRAGEPRLAIEAYERALKQERNDAFSLAGLAQAHFKLGNREKAKEFAGRFAYVWSNCDAGLRWKTEVDALGLDATPIAQTPAPEQPYSVDAQASIGPLNWEPFAAPALECVNTEGKAVQLEDFEGKNVILVFYLGDECPHCVEQLKAINGRAADWEAQNAVVLAVSSASADANKASQKLGAMGITLLSDHEHTNARRFTSYDDFEEMELHSTILIDTKGRVHWKRTGGDPFTDMDFLVESLKQMNAKAAPAMPAAEPPAQDQPKAEQQTQAPVQPQAPAQAEPSKPAAAAAPVDQPAPGLKVGDKAPDATVTGVDGKPVHLSTLYKDGPIVLTFYRGGWCPFCTRALSAWHDKMDALHAAGGTFIALTPEKPALAAATREKSTAGNAQDYAVFSDGTLEAAKAFKVHFVVDAAIQAKYEKFGIKLGESNASGTWELPAPATFVIDKEGVIRWVFADWDYKKRAEPEEVIAKVKEIVKGGR